MCFQTPVLRKHMKKKSHAVGNADRIVMEAVKSKMLMRIRAYKLFKPEAPAL